ncbi:MAG: 2-oxo acid dehydrogenase subunit E2 [Alphaproteobacteria bacterium]|nr:2-oxo acid dehydrogenase subunit E2 [Alphaproteobacteria bacterium]
MANTSLKPYRHASSFRRIAAVAWDEPRDPTIYGTVDVRAEALLEWIDLKRRETGVRITVTHAVVRAVALTLAAHPDCNAVVRWGAPHLRHDVDVFAQVAIPREGGGSADLSGVCVRKADTKDIIAICDELRAGSTRIRNDEDKDFERTKGQAMILPGFILRRVLRFLGFLQKVLNLDTTFLGAPRDPFGSAMVTSLGMMGIDQAYAPFFPLGNCALIVLVGAVNDTPVVEDGQLAVGKVFKLNATCDHRVIDGFHAAKMSAQIKRLLENPRLMESEADKLRAMGGPDPTTDLETLELDHTQDAPTTAEAPTVPGFDEVPPDRAQEE